VTDVQEQAFEDKVLQLQGSRDTLCKPAFYSVKQTLYDIAKKTRTMPEPSAAAAAGDVWLLTESPTATIAKAHAHSRTILVYLHQPTGKDPNFATRQEVILSRPG
jgi:hypothetical protein